MRNKPQNELRNLANSPDYDDQYDDWYEEEVVRASKSKKREQVRFGLKED